MIRVLKLACVASAALFAASCAGAQQSALPLVPGPVPAGTGRETVKLQAIVQFPRDGGADFTLRYPHSLPNKKRYRHVRMTPGMKVFVFAYLYPSYAYYRDAYYSGPATVGKGGIVSIPFGKIVPAKNEWLVVYVDQLGTNGQDGSYIGSEAAVVNVGKSTTSVIATPATTTLFQAFMTMENIGLLAASDLKSASLMSTIASEVKASGIKVDATTGLFSPESLATFINDVKPHWERFVTISGGSTVKMLSISNDVTDTADVYALSNATDFLGTRGSSSSYSSYGPMFAGYPCFTESGDQLPGKQAPPQAKGCATVYPTGTGSITVPVFGGGLVAGASNGAIPYTGASMRIKGGAPGAKSTVTLTQVPTQVTVTTSDPQDWAFGVTPTFTAGIAASGLDTELFNRDSSSSAAFNGNLQMGFSATYSQANPQIDVNAWNPWGLPLSNFSLCSLDGLSCTALPISGTFTVAQRFYDDGASGTYYNWQGQSGTVVSYNVACQGYELTPSAGTIVIKTTTPATFTQSQFMTASFSSCGGGGSPAAGSSVTVTATDAYGNVYSGKGTYSSYDFNMNTTAYALTAATSVTVTISLGSGSPSTIFMDYIGY